MYPYHSLSRGKTSPNYTSQVSQRIKIDQLLINLSIQHQGNRIPKLLQWPTFHTLICPSGFTVFQKSNAFSISASDGVKLNKKTPIHLTSVTSCSGLQQIVHDLRQSVLNCLKSSARWCLKSHRVNDLSQRVNERLGLPKGKPWLPDLLYNIMIIVIIVIVYYYILSLYRSR
jgi:hypothetical protein